jgi:hypothetical protein
MSRTHLMTCVVACLACALVAPVTAQVRDENAPPEYVIEFNRGGGCDFALIRSPDYRGGVYITVPRHTTAAEEAETERVVLGYEVRAQQAEDGWNVTLSVQWVRLTKSGKKQIATYKLQTNEQVEIGELKPYGVAPFRIRVVKVISQPARRPQVINNTQSIAVQKLEVSALPNPYRLTLKNVSDKNVMAVEVSTYAGDRKLTYKTPGDMQWQPFIALGSVNHVEMMSEDFRCAEQDAYRPTQSDKIGIDTVVFTDGTYEGKPYPAAVYKAMALGEKRQLSHILEILDKLGESGLPRAEAMRWLNEQVAALDETADQTLLIQLQDSFPMLDPQTVAGLGSLISTYMCRIKIDLLADVQKLAGIAGKGQELKAVQTWLPPTRAKYERLLPGARLVADH